MSARVRIRHFTDPGSPVAFSAEPQRLRLLWVYGEQVEWETRMAGTSSRADHEADMGAVSGELRALAERSGMPIDPRERRYAAATIHACRAVVAVRLRWPAAADAYLRWLRVLAMSGELLDDSDTLEIAAERSGLPVRELAAYADAPEVHAALAEDMAAAPPICPSYELERVGPPADGVGLAGAQPTEAFDAALAELAPELSRSNDPASPLEVLEWAPYPLATAEIAAVCDAGVDATRAALSRSGAHFTPAGWDGYWSAG